MIRRNKTVLGIIILCAITGVYFLAVAGLDKLWGNVPIAFYGRIVDQNGSPVPGATVLGHVQAEKRLSIPVMGADNSTIWDVSAETDALGNFSIRAGRGWSLHLTAANAPGYIDFRGADYYYHNFGANVPFVADPKKPVIFTLWKQEKKP